MSPQMKRLREVLCLDWGNLRGLLHLVTHVNYKRRKAFMGLLILSCLVYFEQCFCRHVMDWHNIFGDKKKHWRQSVINIVLVLS